MHAEQVEKNPMSSQLGIPQHMGLFYAMGLALVMEGLMSGGFTLTAHGALLCHGAVPGHGGASVRWVYST